MSSKKELKKIHKNLVAFNEILEAVIKVKENKKKLKKKDKQLIIKYLSAE